MIAQEFREFGPDLDDRNIVWVPSGSAFEGQVSRRYSSFYSSIRIEDRAVRVVSDSARQVKLDYKKVFARWVDRRICSDR